MATARGVVELIGLAPSYHASHENVSGRKIPATRSRFGVNCQT